MGILTLEHFLDTCLKQIFAILHILQMLLCDNPCHSVLRWGETILTVAVHYDMLTVDFVT